MKASPPPPPVPAMTSPYLPPGDAYIFDTHFFEYQFSGPFSNRRPPREGYPPRLNGETKAAYDARIIEWLARHKRAVVIKGIGA